MEVAGGRGDVAVAEDALDGVEVAAVGQQARGRRVAEEVRS